MLKRLVALLTLALLAALPVSAQSVTLSLDAGLLTDHNGNDLSTSDLILLIASPTGSFTPTTGSEFVSGNDLIVGAAGGVVTGAFSPNYALTTQGETLNNITFDLGIGATGNASSVQSSIVAGDALAIRWYDNFTLADFEAGETPTSGYYGTYTGGATPDFGAAWSIPAAGSFDTGSNGLEVFTSNDPLGGDPNISPSDLEALTPVATAVPEPSSYALMATALVFFAGLALKRKQLASATK
jgi:hypothetical protein